MYIVCLINAVSLITAFIVITRPWDSSCCKMILNDFSGPELSNHGQKLILLCLFVIFGFQIFFDLQEICHLEREFETGLSTFINILSIFQVTFQIPFGEIRKHFMEELVFISPS